mmetsp:Transcript_24928/g.34636  ORF Transcript_24928/g.34636 Transcript_24928/m.34636 type:complete len:301 (+) Transcript_24928:26-928(+)|eukprot:jgi/Bigna1/90178/estExt_fgenesh1_pg.C_640058
MGAAPSSSSTTTSAIGRHRVVGKKHDSRVSARDRLLAEVGALSKELAFKSQRLKALLKRLEENPVRELPLRPRAEKTPGKDHRAKPLKEIPNEKKQHDKENQKENVRWIQYICESTLYPYYVNIETGETTWVGPEGGFAVNEEDYLTFKKLPFSEEEFLRVTADVFRKMEIGKDKTVDIKEFLAKKHGDSRASEILAGLLSKFKGSEPGNGRTTIQGFRLLCKGFIDHHGPELFATMIEKEFEIQLRLANALDMSMRSEDYPERVNDNVRQEVKRLFKKHNATLSSALLDDLSRWRTGDQ